MSSMKLQMKSASLTRQNILRLGELFPGCIVEVKDDKGVICLAVDFERLRQELGDSLVEGERERYHLDWPGKRESLVLANAPVTKTLRPLRDESVDFDTTKNLFLEGDNLDALKLIQENYLGKVKMIYIDPPYNTGKDFIYEDDFSEDAETFLRKSLQKTDGGEKLVANTEANGRFHSDWLSMMHSRLRLAKGLLTQDGAIFVSCDEGEHPRLRMVMDEIFGQSNFIADMVWAAGRKNDSRLVSVSHEYITCYAQNVDYLREKQIIWRQRKKGIDEIYAQHNRLKRQHGTDYKAMTEGMKKWYRGLADGHPAKNHKHYSHVDARGIYFPDNISWPGGGGPKYEVLHPVTKKPVKVPSRGWMTSDPKRMQEWIDDDRVHFGEDENAVPCIKSHLKDKELQTPYSVFYQDGRAASKRLRTLMDGNIFDFPKDEFVLQDIVGMLTGQDDIILDFFAGSSTAAHSVMLQNATDGGNRRFIMVQIDEKIAEKSAAFQTGFKTIAEIGRERIRRAGKKIMEGDCHLNWNRDVGFRLLKIDTSNMKDVFYRPDEFAQQTLDGMVDNVKADRSGEDLLFQVLVDWGVDLSLPIARETLNSNTVFVVGEDVAAPDLIACFDANIGEDLMKLLAERHPLRVVFRDTGFATDSVKINAQQIFKQFSSTTEFKTV